MPVKGKYSSLLFATYEDLLLMFFGVDHNGRAATESIKNKSQKNTRI